MKKENLLTRLIELREEKGLSQNQLSKELNISQAAISKWEAGVSKPNIDCLITLADFFGVSTDYLLGRDN